MAQVLSFLGDICLKIKLEWYIDTFPLLGRWGKVLQYVDKQKEEGEIERKR